jgi:hypothetical protein
MFGTVFPSQHSTQYVKRIVTDIKYAEIQTSNVRRLDSLDPRLTLIQGGTN